MHKQQENKIVEDSSPLFQEGFFRGVEATEQQKYNCAECLTKMKERGYTINSSAGQKFVAGWKFSNE
ncbi:hypothetical protein D3C87_323340 [compost metagenome]